MKPTRTKDAAEYATRRLSEARKNLRRVRRKYNAIAQEHGYGIWGEYIAAQSV